MKRHAIATIVPLLVLLSLAAPSARSRAESAPISRSAVLQTITLHSRALGGVTHLIVLLPDDYATGQRRYPVLYLLGGHLGTYTQWETKSDVVSFAQGLPLIIVMPDSGNGWFSNPASGSGPRWGDYVVDELIPYIDSHYPTIRGRQGRAIAGLSMGALGAFDYAALHPDLFVAAASFSGSLNLVAMESSGWLTAFPSLRTVFGDPATHALYWLGHDPIELAPNLQGLRLYMASGNGQPGPFDGHRTWSDPGEVYSRAAMLDMVTALKKAGIAATVEDYGNGTHTWPYWTRDLHHAMPLILDAFAHPPAPPTPWSYRTIADGFSVWGYHVIRTSGAPGWIELRDVSRSGLTVDASGDLTIVTAPLYVRDATYRLTLDGVSQSVRADAAGRLYLRVARGNMEASHDITVTP